MSPEKFMLTAVLIPTFLIATLYYYVNIITPYRKKKVQYVYLCPYHTRKRSAQSPKPMWTVVSSSQCEECESS